LLSSKKKSIIYLLQKLPVLEGFPGGNALPDFQVELSPVLVCVAVAAPANAPAGATPRDSSGLKMANINWVPAEPDKTSWPPVPNTNPKDGDPCPDKEDPPDAWGMKPTSRDVDAPLLCSVPDADRNRSQVIWAPPEIAASTAAALKLNWDPELT
jgi:hypothetical protein